MSIVFYSDTEMKNSLWGFNCNQKKKVEFKISMKLSSLGAGRMKKNGQNLRDLKDSIKNKIYIVQVPGRGWDWEMGRKKYLKK